MPEYNFNIGFEHATLELNFDQLEASNNLNIYNDIDNPAEKLFIKLPPQNIKSTSSLTNWQSSLSLKSGLSPELIILINSNTAIDGTKFEGFEHILISDQKILDQDNEKVVLSSTANYNARLLIKNFHTKEGFIFCNQLKMEGKSEIVDTLGISLSGNNTQLDILGNEPDSFVISKLDILSNVSCLSLSKVLIKKQWTSRNIDILSIKDCTAYSDWFLGKIINLKEFSLRAASKISELHTDQAIIRSIYCPKGKFYISASSYIDFKIDHKDLFGGIELVLDMSLSNNVDKKITFPNHTFKFDKITIIGSSSVNMPLGGTCRQLLLQDCLNVRIFRFISSEVLFDSAAKPGVLYIDGSEITSDLFIFGKNMVILDKVKVKNIEAYGVCNLNLKNNTKCDSVKLNLNLDASNPGNTIQAGDAALRIDNKNNQPLEIKLIIAKLSTFYVSGNVKFGTILIQSIDKLTSLLWGNVESQTKMDLERIFIFNDHDIQVLPGGSIQIKKSSANLSQSGETFISVAANTQEFFHVSAAKGIRFHGIIESAKDIGFFSKYSNIFATGYLKAANNLMLCANQGSINSFACNMEARAVTISSNVDTYLSSTEIKSQEIISYTLGHYVQTQLSSLSAEHIVLIAEKDIKINQGNIGTSQSLIIKSNNSVIQDSSIYTGSLYVKAIHNLLLANSGIKLTDHFHNLFADKITEDGSLIQFGFKIANDLTVIGVLSSDKTNLSANIQWQKVEFTSNEIIEPGKAYVEANKGYIIGSSIEADKMQVIIKTCHSLEVVPLVLYNELAAAGGLNINSIKLVASQINAGLIDIDAGKLGIFVSSLLKAATGSVSADTLSALLHPVNKIKVQQERIRVLGDEWQVSMLPSLANQTIGEYFNFSQSTAISQRISNLAFTDNYSSKDLIFTEREGDIIFDKSWTSKYDRFILNVEKGKVLITSKHLQNIYQSHSNSEEGKEAAMNARTVIGGNNVYIKADALISEAGKFDIKGDLTIVTKDGVHIFPVAVHQRLEYHLGDKDTHIEYAVRQVLSEINAGYLNIKTSDEGILELKSAIIKATGVNLDVGQLQITSAREITEKHVYFKGKKKWSGGRNSWEDHKISNDVVATNIQVGGAGLVADIKGNALIGSAQITTEADSVIKTGGDLRLINEFSFKLHDHHSKKSYLFRCHGGKFTVAGSKTVKEHFYGEEVIPTIYHSQGSFFGFSEGKIHLLSSEIRGNEIILHGKKGVKLEAASYKTEHFVSISDKGTRFGFETDRNSVGVVSELFYDMNKTEVAMTQAYASKLISETGLKIISDDKLHLVSSQMHFKDAQINVRDFVADTIDETITQSGVTQSFRAGLKIGLEENVSAVFLSAKDLLSKRIESGLDVADSAFKVPMLYEQAGQALAQPVQGGIFVSVKASSSEYSSSSASAAHNVISGGSLKANVQESTTLHGVECTLGDFTLNTRSFSASAASTRSTSSFSSANLDIKIPITGDIAGLSMNLSQGENEEVRYHNNFIKVSGKMVLNIEEDGTIKGVAFEANTAEVNARNLSIETLQDTLRSQIHRASFAFTPAQALEEGGDKGADHFRPEMSSETRNAKWSNALGSIIGNNVSVVVKEALQMTGAIIEGTENTKVKAGSLSATTLHDFDNTKKIGLGLGIASKVDKEGDKAEGGASAGEDGARTAKIDGFKPIYGYVLKSRDLRPVIGSNGTVEVGGVALSQDSRAAQGIASSRETQVINESRESGHFDADLMPMGRLLQKSLEKYRNEKGLNDIKKDLVQENAGVAAGDEYRSVTEEEKQQTTDELKQEMQSSLKMPESLTEEQKSLVKQIAYSIEKDFPELPEDFKNLATITAFNKLQEPQLQPNLLAASRIAAGIGGSILGVAAETAIGTAVEGTIGAAIGTAITKAFSALSGYSEYVSSPEFNQEINYTRALERKSKGLSTTFILIEDTTYNALNEFAKAMTINANGTYSTDVIPVDQPYESQTVRERKIEVKGKLGKAAEALGKVNPDQCAILRVMPVEYIVQMVVNSAEASVPSILNDSLPLLWSRANVIGILKHSFAKNYLNSYNKTCDDGRVEPEVRYINGNPWSPGDPLKRSVVIDLIDRENKKGWDEKYGKQGVSTKDADKKLFHAFSDVKKIFEVRPSTSDSIINQKLIKSIP